MQARPRLAACLLLVTAACAGGPHAAPGAVTGIGPTPAAGAAAAGPTVRAVDWMNRTYDHEGPTVTVVDGEAELVLDPEFPEETGWFSVAPPSFGDLDGDGREEALVTTLFSGGGTGRFSSVLVFTVRPGEAEPVLLGTIPGGDRGDGGVLDARIDGAVVTLDRMKSLDDDGACCPSRLVHEVWRWNGAGFVEDEAARTEGPFGEGP